jgi:hypothetical protein
LQRAFCENFTGIITHPITHAELKGLKQKGGESRRVRAGPSTATGWSGANRTRHATAALFACALAWFQCVFPSTSTSPHRRSNPRANPAPPLSFCPPQPVGRGRALCVGKERSHHCLILRDLSSIIVWPCRSTLPPPVRRLTVLQFWSHRSASLLRPNWAGTAVVVQVVRLKPN